jgi:TonB family protein
MKTAIESHPLLAAGRIAIVILALFNVAIPGILLLAQQAQPETHRKALQKVAPHYPQMAKAMKLSGAVRVAVKVAPNGKVVSAEVLGGHPLLTEVAVDAARQFRFETAPKQTEEVVTFNFQPEVRTVAQTRTAPLSKLK